jgi:cyclopropane-fatty-acyl-phospholipid synthase
MKPDDKYKAVCLSFFDDLLSDYHPRDFTIRLWDGSTIDPEPGEDSKFTLVINDPGTVRRMFSSADEVTMGEAYIYGDCDIEGDCESVFDLAEHLIGRKLGLTGKLRLGAKLMKLPSGRKAKSGRQAAELRGSRHSVERDKKAVTYHYDVSNDFFATYLDRNMVYSCGYFESPDDDIDVAQKRKLDYICRKLRVENGERLLDIGCGWGGLVIHAAREYGARALGITLSEPQAELANRRIKEAGLTDRCRVELRDYREMEKESGFDKIVSVGMFEHVGESKLPEYFRQAYDLLKPGGVFLNHGIARNAALPTTNRPSFSDKYVFPDGELLPVSKTMTIAEKAGFEVRDVESLREHYAMTLRHWVRRLEANHDEALRAGDETTYRVWRLYMSGSAHGFHTGRLNVYQALLVNSGKSPSGLPLTRGDWYSGQ